MSEGRGQTLPAAPSHGRHPYGISEGRAEWNFDLFDEHSQGMACAMGYTPDSRNEAGLMIFLAEVRPLIAGGTGAGGAQTPQEEETPIAGGTGAGGGQTPRIDERVAKVGLSSS